MKTAVKTPARKTNNQASISRVGGGGGDGDAAASGRNQFEFAPFMYEQCLGLYLV
jgi:hypothetical protein